LELACRPKKHGCCADCARRARGPGRVLWPATGEITTGRIVAALKQLGFDQIYDTSFAADLTVIEEGTEFLERKTPAELCRCSPPAAPAGSSTRSSISLNCCPIFHVPLTAGDVWVAGEGDASRSAQGRPQGPQSRGHHAVHGKKFEAQRPEMAWMATRTWIMC